MSILCYNISRVNKGMLIGVLFIQINFSKTHSVEIVRILFFHHCKGRVVRSTKRVLPESELSFRLMSKCLKDSWGSLIACSQWGLPLTIVVIL